MPTASRKKKPTAKKKVIKKKPAKKRTPGRAKKILKKAVKKAVKKITKQKIKMIGEVSHYYGQIGVAIIELKMPIKVGDIIRFKHGEVDRMEAVTSMQIDHEPVSSAKKGDVIGMKVIQKTPPGAMVLPG